MLQEIWAELRWEPLEFTDLGERCGRDQDCGPRAVAAKSRIEADETDVFWFRDGELVRVQGFPTKAEAVEAVESSAG